MSSADLHSVHDSDSKLDSKVDAGRRDGPNPIKRTLDGFAAVWLEKRGFNLAPLSTTIAKTIKTAPLSEKKTRGKNELLRFMKTEITNIWHVRIVC